MAAEITTLFGQLAGNILRDTSVTNVTALGHTGSTTIYAVEFDNTANSVVTYLKIYEDGTPVIGTTQPSFILKAQPFTKEYFSAPTGVTHATAITYLATTTASNATASPAAPTTACTLTVLFG